MLTRSDIVGKRVLRVLRTAWKACRSAGELTIHVSETFVQLDSGIWLELLYTEDGDRPLPIVAVDVDTQDLVSASVEEDCRGKRIEEVVISPLWGSYGLLLSGGLLLHVDVSGDFVGPAVSRISTIDTPSDYTTFWRRQPLPQWDLLFPGDPSWGAPDRD